MIAVDWGTSSLRAYRLNAEGDVVEQRSAAVGLLACHGAFEAVLAQQLSDWTEELVVMCGMIGSRNGWHEVPYVRCPAGLDAIAAGMLEIATSGPPGRRVFIVPGLSAGAESALPEVMRGEETQLLGLLDGLPDNGSHTVCLPGTHSKWTTVGGGCIGDFRTAMTGELYAVLRQHSLLGALMADEADHKVGDAGGNEAAFASGVAISGRAGGLLNHLFSVRTRGLFGELSAARLPWYLSGLLIGHELRGLLSATQRVHLIGSDALVRRYQVALALLDVESTVYAEALAARGLHRLARVRGLLPLGTQAR